MRKKYKVQYDNLPLSIIKDVYNSQEKYVFFKGYKIDI